MHTYPNHTQSASNLTNPAAKPIDEIFSRHLAIVNCCSITNKREDLELFLSNNHIEILLITESKLDCAITNAEIFPKKLLLL